MKKNGREKGKRRSVWRERKKKERKKKGREEKKGGGERRSDVVIKKCVCCCARVGAQAKRKAPQYIDFGTFFCRDHLSLYGKKTPGNVLPCYGGQIKIPRQKI